MQIDGYSLDAQKAHMKAYADFNDYQIVGEYEDAGKLRCLGVFSVGFGCQLVMAAIVYVMNANTIRITG